MASEPQKLRFTIQGDPVPKERARTSPKMTRDGRIEMINGHPVMRTRTPEKTRAWETYISLIARQAIARNRFVHPEDAWISLGCIFYLPIPKTWPVSKRQQALEGIIRPTGTPDLSNLLKSIEDGCEGVLWTNDSAIVEYGTVDGRPTSKHYSDTPRVEIEVVYHAT